MNDKLMTLMTQIKTLSLEEQRMLNSMLVENLRHASRVKNVVASSAFSVGDTVVFDAGRKGIIKATITGFSRDHSKIKCTQIGGMRAGCLWTAAAALCKKA